LCSNCYLNRVFYLFEIVTESVVSKGTSSSIANSVYYSVYYSPPVITVFVGKIKKRFPWPFLFTISYGNRIDEQGTFWTLVLKTYGCKTNSHLIVAYKKLLYSCKQDEKQKNKELSWLKFSSFILLPCSIKYFTYSHNTQKINAFECNNTHDHYRHRHHHHFETQT